MGEVIADRYELEELVGSGGMSSVYRARDRLLERHVALKILHSQFMDDDEYVERFRREARAVAQLSHPNIVTVIDRGQDGGRQFIVFEYVEGESLKGLIERSGPLPIRRALELALDIARALAFAHENGLVHRDVKPQNVLLNGEDTAKVTDFGIARSLDVEQSVTQPGTVLGSSNYIAPEQANGEPVDERTDVYSLGVVLYEMLAGGVPFEGDNFVAVAMKHIHEPAPSLLEKRPEAPLRLVQAVERALEKDPARRFATMNAFAAELEACLAELGAADGDPTMIVPSAVVRRSPAHHERTRRRAWPLVLTLLALAAIAAVVIGVLALRGSNGNGGKAAGSASQVRLRGVTAYDPQGNGEEHNAAAVNATDGNASTYWATEHYLTPNLGGLKDGVGVVVDAGAARKLQRLTVITTTPGFTAEIRAGNSSSGGFAPDSAPRKVNGTTAFPLRGRRARYYVVWITNLGPNQQVRIAEVRAG